MRLDPLVTNVYAEAFYSAAKKHGITLPLTEEAQDVIGLLDKERRLIQFLEGPHVPTEAKLDLVEKIFRDRCRPLLTNFILYLIRKGRIEYLHDILERFQILVQMDEGIFPATITTAKDLSFTEKLQLKSALEKFTHKQLNVDYKTDASLLGGVIAAVQDTYIDDSVRGLLKRLREQLQHAAVH